MTLKEISVLYDLPVSTLKDWRNPLHKRHKLFLHLQNGNDSQRDTRQIRLLQLLNRNITPEYHFALNELRECFQKKHYGKTTQREKIILAKLFKEGDIEDAHEVERVLNINGDNIRCLFKSSPYQKAYGFEKWQKEYGLAWKRDIATFQNQKIKPYLANFLEQRNIHV